MERIILCEVIRQFEAHGIALPRAISILGKECEQRRLLSWAIAAGGIRSFEGPHDEGSLRAVRQSEWCDILKAKTFDDGRVVYEDAKLIATGAWHDDDITIIRKPHPTLNFDGNRWGVSLARKEVIQLRGFRFDSDQFRRIIRAVTSPGVMTEDEIDAYVLGNIELTEIPFWEKFKDDVPIERRPLKKTVMGIYKIRRPPKKGRPSRTDD